MKGKTEMKKTMKALATALTFACAAAGTPSVARAAATGDIYEIRPVDETGAAISNPTEYLDGGDVARFVVRLIAPQGGNPFYLSYCGHGSEAVDWVANPPTIGVYVNGKRTQAVLEKAKPNANAGDYFYDLIFAYRVQPGDFALPIRLATSDGKMVTDDGAAPALEYDLNMLQGMASRVWRVWNAQEGAATTNEASFYYGAGYNTPQKPEVNRVSDYSLAGADFRVKTVDFDAAWEQEGVLWRSVHEGGSEVVGGVPSFEVSGMPTNAVKLYVWSEDESAVKVVAGKDVTAVTQRDVHFAAGAAPKKVWVGEVNVKAGKQKYEFAIEGVAQGGKTNLVLSAFPDYNYSTSAYETGVRLDDYVTVPVACIEPMPASVVLKPQAERVTATPRYKESVTQLDLRFTQNPLGRDVEATVEIGFTAAGCPNKWWDYVRLSGGANDDTTLAKPPFDDPKVTIDATGKAVKLNDTPLTDGKIYVYALRSDAWVTGDNKLTFTPKTADAEASAAISGFGAVQSSLTVEAVDPAIESMFDGTDETTADDKVDQQLQIVVSDVYADMHSADEESFEVEVCPNIGEPGAKFQKVPGLFKPGKGNVLFLTNGTETVSETMPMAKFAYEPKTLGTVTAKVRVKSLLSGNTSAEYVFTVHVSKPNTYTVTKGEERDYEEGEEINLKIELKEENTLGDIYAYLKGVSDDDQAAVDCKWKAEAGRAGLKLANYGRTVSGRMQILDGDGSKMGSSHYFEVVFLRTANWSDDPMDRVGAYQAENQVEVISHNVAPKIGLVSVNDGLYEISEDGATIPTKFPINIKQTFAVAVYDGDEGEPSLIDKTSTESPFQVRWFFTDAYGVKSGPEEAPTDGIVKGNPDDTSCSFTFESEGVYTVTVELKDKDMTKWGNREDGDSATQRISGNGRKFTFKVEVIDKPSITVEAQSPYEETQSLDNGGEASLDVRLDVNQCNFDLWVNLKIEPLSPSGTPAKDGLLVLQETDDCVKQPDGSYNVRFPKFTTVRTLLIQTLDGTLVSKTTGFKLTPTVVPDSAHTVPGFNDNPENVYMGVVPPAVKVSNVAPYIDEADVYPSTSVTNVTSVGLADETITWSFTDVKPDFERATWPDGGIKVEFKGGGGWGPQYFYTLAEAQAAGATGFRPYFAQPGIGQTVKLVVTDPDGGVTTVTWLYNVTGVKTIYAVAHGPGSGYGAAHSKRYRTAGGLGEGRVYAESKSDIATVDWKSTINNGSTDSAYVFAYGYKVGDVDNGADLRKPDGFGGYEPGYYLKRDTPINSDGGNLLVGQTAYSYPPEDPVRRREFLDKNGNLCDSFLYTWLKMTISDDGKTTSDEYLNSATAPEYINVQKDQGAPVSLKNEESDTGAGFSDTFLEAVFSREFLASDNMGDINADGIPDVYVDKFGLGVVDTTGSGEMTGDDLLPKDAFNEDEDYLPSMDMSAYGRLIPGLSESWATVGRPFTALLEIRGYAEDDPKSKLFGSVSALNDASSNNEKTKIPNLKSDRLYLDPYEAPTSTLSRVEYLAWTEWAAANGVTDLSDRTKWLLWSPERPSDPTLADTDEDGLPDGYEYYFWYRAHVGYMENGVHKRLTGRKYDPRNPGEGTLITAQEIEDSMDPVVSSGDAASADTRDSDNDGLPDLIEFEIGTNPFDFDTDGDGLPDGWEIVIAGLDPLNASTSGDNQFDTERNYDGDAMAFTTVKGEESVLPKPRFIQSYNTFAVVDADGDTDGIQWYAETPKDDGTTAFAFTLEEDADNFVGTVFEIEGVSYVTPDGSFAMTADNRLAKSLTEDTFVVTNLADAAEALGVDASAATVGYVRLRPARVLAGAVVTSATPGTAYAVARTDVSGADADSCNAAWVYGRGDAIVGDFGMLALARHALPCANAPVAELPSRDRDVAYLHYLVYQQFGFDPRTAWNPKTPLAARWGETADNGGAYASTTSKKKGYAGEATRTRAYSAYDEFLLYSFFLNNGCDMSGYKVVSDNAGELLRLWYAFTTNPRGPAEPAWVSEVNYKGWTAEGLNGVNGADTDGDGVPDGWELYVMAGPKLEKKDLLGNVTARTFNFAPAYAGFTVSGEEVIEMPRSYFSPFVDAADLAETDSPKYIGKDMQDGLGEREEFAGTDSCAYYAEVQDGNEVAYSSTIVRPESQAKWLNKFFPTDPWVPDTDDDGVKDGEEGKAFVYAETVPEDDKATTSFPGCGLNPCSVDTDQDGLPDGWEKQFTLEPAEAVVSTNAVEGLVNCMDGTVPDALTKPDGPNRDYDHDGLENWQEYMTGTMRCWRYDDPYTQWGSIPEEAYYADGQFSPDFKALGLADGDWDAFWYETLVHVGGPIYNPHLVTDQSPSGQYFSRVDVGWDPNYWDSVICNGNPDPLKGTGGTYYWFCHRIGRTPYVKAWSEFYDKAYKGATYVSCSPINEDSDHDGMDDFYELFHGLNPLLGGDETPKVENPCDVVRHSGENLKPGPARYFDNPWCSQWNMNPPMRPARPLCNNPDFDFVVHPWKNGLQTADADGDNELNYVESLLSKFLTGWGLHTDPSPLWMTDTSYSNSLTRLHYRLPSSNYIVPFGATKVVDPNGKMVPGFTGPDGKRYFFRDFDAYDMNSEGETADQFWCDHWWSVGGSMTMFSFEENEGFDTDHDGLNDEEELSNHFRGATDPLDAESPRRRQAIYFPGQDAALQTPPEVLEEHPIVGTVYKTDPSFCQYTVECWVRPDEARNATIVERAIQNGGSNAGDRDIVRKNFLLGTRLDADGQCRWFTKFDSNGTGTRDEVAVLSSKSVEPGVWTHVAATYDGKRLLLYVNGQSSGTMPGSGDTAQLPECAVSQVVVGQTGSAFADSGRMEYAKQVPLVAIVVGASVKTYSDFPDVPFKEQVCGNALNLYNGLGWNYYKDFFKGYVDEIRIWDGARSQEDIQGAMKVRFDAEMAKKNRNDVYDQWRMGVHRYEKKGDGADSVVPAELLYHFTFDALPSAENAGQLAVVPHGFDCGEKAWLSRPEGYAVAWWKRVLEGYGSAYGGAADFVTWIPNTVARLPRFDGTTQDSAFWSDDFEGGQMKTCRFAHTAEPYPKWQQVRFGVFGEPGDQYSTLSRWYLANRVATGTDFAWMFDFVGRTALCEGADLLPLGGAFARYVDKMWDDQGASSMWEMTGSDLDNDGLPDWWQEYAEQNYRDGLPKDEDIGWTTLVWYGDGERKIKIPASEAYLRDLARGYYVNEAGVVVKDGKFRQKADEDRNGIPDWWEDMYGIRGEAGLADHDNDGLPNYVEYLLSEVFAFKNVMFNPTDPCSVDDSTPDYFYRVGEVYVGEIFTDHDLMDDSWEDLYGDDYASRLAWDALADADEDGWSNRSENRYSKAVMPIIADQRTHYTAADGLVADYPIPTIALTLSYGGKRATAVENAPIAVEISTRAPFAKDPDAFYLVGAAEASNGDTGTRSDSEGSKDTASTETSRTRTLGKWSNRHAIGTLTPGNIKQNSLVLEFCYDPSSIVYSWDVAIAHIGGTTEVITKRGSRSEYDADKRMYGDENVKLLSTSSDYAELRDLELRTDEGSSVATWIHTKSNLELGTVNLVTGEFDLNLGVFAGYYVTSGTNDAEYVSLEDQTFRIAYTANPSVGLPRELYLGAADKGYVREGKNTVVAWADLNGDGKWDVGEPYGLARDVDVSWRGTKVGIELTDASPIMPRIDLTGDASDLGKTVQDVYEEVLTDNRYPDYARRWIDNNKIEVVPVTDATFRGQRIRVVRWLVNNYPVYAAGGTAPRVVFDNMIETDVRTVLTEADLLAAGKAFDLEWETLRDEVIANEGVKALCGDVRSVTYLVVVGDGRIGWSEYNDTNTVKALNSVLVRRFGDTWLWPTPVSASSDKGAIVNAANPTFTWRLDDCPKEEGYTAFRIHVFDGSGRTMIWDSGVQAVPPRNVAGEYVWEAPLYAGDKTLLNRVFENKKTYTWKVAMYNAKYSDLGEAGAFGASGTFSLNVQTNGYSYGTANVAVRYFGPRKTWAGGAAKKTESVIRVRAYTSPDFTGVPVSAGYVTDSVSVTNREATVNCHVVGLPKGSYYLQAFVDSNGNGSCEPWETQGYLCARDGSTADWLNPTAITFGEEVGTGDTAVIYLEDADTDGDGLPDGWEYAEFGSLTAQGLNLISETKAGERLVNEKLSGEMALQANAQVPTAGLAGRVGNMLKTLASPVGVAAATGIDPADIEVSDGGLVVKSEIDPDSLTIVGFAVDAAQNRVLLKVGAETTADVNAVVANLLNITVKKGAEVTVKVEHALSPTGPWQVLPGVGGKVTVDRAGADIEVQLSGELPAQGYFRAKVEE